VSFGDLAAEGAYTISETPQAGWTEIGAVGGGSGQAAGGATSCSFTVDYVTDSGKTYTCTFTNRARGRIIVDKVTNPSGSSQSFGFTSALGNFSLTDAATPKDFTVDPGTYSVSESSTAGWDLTKLVCSDSSSQSGATASVTLSAGQTVTCTFTN